MITIPEITLMIIIPEITLISLSKSFRWYLGHIWKMGWHTSQTEQYTEFLQYNRLFSNRTEWSISKKRKLKEQRAHVLQNQFLLFKLTLNRIFRSFKVQLELHRAAIWLLPHNKQIKEVVQSLEYSNKTVIYLLVFGCWLCVTTVVDC